MGYRNYIAVVDKESLDKIRGLSYDEVKEKYGDEGYISEYTFNDKGIKIKRILEIGEIVSYKENSAKLKECLSPVFSDNKINEVLNNDSEFMLGNKKLLENIIEVYRKTVVEYYTDIQNIDKIREMRSDPTVNHLNYFLTKCRNKVSEFSENWFVSDSDNILHYTWQYEYDIFNLIYILKTFGWNKNYLLWIGG